MIVTFAPYFKKPTVMDQPITKHFPLILCLIVIAAAARLLPHPPNFVPTGAMALFGAAALPKKWLAILVPLVAFYLSDLVLNNLVYAQYFEGFYFGADLYVYGGLLLMILVGMGVLRNRNFSWARVGGAAIGATVAFFLVTNLGVWASGLLYPTTPTGLVAAYMAGLPFLLNSLLANLIFSGVLFGVARYAGLFDKKSQTTPAYTTVRK